VPGRTLGTGDRDRIALGALTGDVDARMRRVEVRRGGESRRPDGGHVGLERGDARSRARRRFDQQPIPNQQPDLDE